MLFFVILEPINGVVLVLIPFKFLQLEQTNMINGILYEKAIILNGKKNQKHIKQKIANKSYIYIFLSLKIVLSKKFKQYILNQHKFID